MGASIVSLTMECYNWIVMIYIKFLNLSEEKQEELLKVSREHVTYLFGDSIKKYVDKTGADYERLIDEETIKNLYTYNYVFNI